MNRMRQDPCQLRRPARALVSAVLLAALLPSGAARADTIYLPGSPDGTQDCACPLEQGGARWSGGTPSAVPRTGPDATDCAWPDAADATRRV